MGCAGQEGVKPPRAPRSSGKPGRARRRAAGPRRAPCGEARRPAAPEPPGAAALGPGAEMSRSALLLLCLLGCHIWKAVTKTLREPGPGGAQGRWVAAGALCRGPCAAAAWSSPGSERAGEARGAAGRGGARRGPSLCTTASRATRAPGVPRLAPGPDRVPAAAPSGARLFCCGGGRVAAAPVPAAPRDLESAVVALHSPAALRESFGVPPAQSLSDVFSKPVGIYSGA